MTNSGETRGVRVKREGTEGDKEKERDPVESRDRSKAEESRQRKWADETKKGSRRACREITFVGQFNDMHDTNIQYK